MPRGKSQAKPHSGSTPKAFATSGRTALGATAAISSPFNRILTIGRAAIFERPSGDHPLLADADVAQCYAHAPVPQNPTAEVISCEAPSA
jgi:hypothetical protein